MKSYTELITIDTFEERYNYLKLSNSVGQDTFGFDRYLNQVFYKSPEWKAIRNKVILRDNGCDLAMEDCEIHGRILIHHMNPINLKDILDRSSEILNPEYLICVSHKTHNAIHYGDDSFLRNRVPTQRQANDTCPWKR